MLIVRGRVGFRPDLKVLFWGPNILSVDPAANKRMQIR